MLCIDDSNLHHETAMSNPIKFFIITLEDLETRVHDEV